MKKTVIALIMANAFTATSAFAAADAGTWYSGAKFGWSHYFDTNMGSKAFENTHLTTSILTMIMSAGVFIRVIRLPHGLR
jgi:OOP family OmpA-OmpF porin